MLLQRLKAAWLRHNTSDARLLRIDVSKSALQNNVRAFRTLVGNRRIMAVLKANAYGHGLLHVSAVLERDHNVAGFCVDSVVEARILRHHNIRKPLIIMGYIPCAGVDELRSLSQTTLFVNSLAQARDLAECVTFPLCVHLKIDTGMFRNGIESKHLKDVLQVLHANRFIRVTGIATHLADADSGDSDTKTHAQLTMWKGAVQAVRQSVAEPLDLHFAATAGTRYINDAQSNMVRLGLGTYGYDPLHRANLHLTPVLRFVAKIINIKTAPPNSSIGYNGTYTTTAERIIAVLPCGYQEGIGRALSNAGTVYVNNTPVSIVGRVSMNLTTIDVTDVPKTPMLETEVEVISNDPNKQNSAANLAKLCGTIPYEIFTRLSADVRRELVE